MAGLTAATSLRATDKLVSITLVDPKDYCEIHWASIRNIFDPEMAHASTFDLKKWAVSKSITIIQDQVTQLTETTATLQSDGSLIEFNIAVICTGAQTKCPALGRGPPKKLGSRQRRLKQLESEGEKYRQAKSILIVGGGLIGTEMAGDVACFCGQAATEQNRPPPKITLVHSRPQLCPEELTPKAAFMLQSKLQSMGVEILLNEKVVMRKSKATTPIPALQLQSSGKIVQADQVIWTTGFYACNSFLDAKYLDAKGFIQVDDYFRVLNKETEKAVPSLFALGDCCDLLPNAGSQILGTMGVIGKNIQVSLDALQSGATDEAVTKKMRKALAQPAVYVQTAGKATGVAQLPCCHTQFILPWMKNSSMFLFKPKSALGLK